MQLGHETFIYIKNQFVVFSILPNLLECVGVNYANLLAFPILPICHSVGSKIIKCDNQSKIHNGCLIQGECMKGDSLCCKKHHPKSISFVFFFFEPWKDKIIKQHSIHSISIKFFLCTPMLMLTTIVGCIFFLSVPNSCHTSPFSIFLT